MNNTTKTRNLSDVRISVPGSKPGRVYTITVPASGAPAYCSCPAWRFQKVHPADRSCKHLDAFVSRFN